MNAAATNANEQVLVPLSQSFEKHVQSILPVSPGYNEKKAEFFKRLELLSIEIQYHAVSILFGIKEEGSSKHFINDHFVSKTDVQENHGESLLCIEKVHSLVLTQMEVHNKQYVRHFNIQATHYCIPKDKLADLIRSFSENELLVKWRAFLPQHNNAADPDPELEKHKKNLSKFVDSFNDNKHNRPHFRKIALALLEDLKKNAWRYVNNIAIIPLELEVPAARKGFIQLYKCQDETVKEAALLYFIEIVQCDPLTMQSAFNLVDVQKDLLEEIAPIKVQALNRRVMHLLSKAFAVNLKCIHNHGELMHLEAVADQTKQDLWTGSENFKGLIVREDPEIQYWLKYAIQSAENLQSDKSKFKDLMGRMLGLVRIGVNLAAIYLDPSAAPQLVDPIFLELVAMFHHIEWKASWYQQLSVFEKLCYYSMNNIECFRKIVAIVHSRKNQNYHPDLLYGGVAALEYVIAHSVNSEIQEGGIKLFIQILALKIPLIESRIIYAFTQMLHFKGKLGNTAYVILKIMQSCGMLNDKVTKTLIGDDAISRDLSLKLMHHSTQSHPADKPEELLYINVIKFFLRWVADVNRAQDCGGLSLANLVAASRDDHIVPVILKCLNEMSNEFSETDVLGRTAYHIAARLGNGTMIRHVQKCLPAVPVDFRDYADGKSAVHEAVEYRSLGALEALAIIGANLNLKNNDGKTALHLSAAKKDLEMASKLLDSGADPNISDGRHTPFNISLMEDDLDMVKLFKSRGAKIAEQIQHCSSKIPTCYLVTPIILAARNLAMRSLVYLLQNSKEPLTPLELMEIRHLGQRHEGSADKKELSVLLKSPSFQSALSEDFGRNQLIECAKSPDKLSELIELAKDKNLINKPDSFGITALHTAVFCRNYNGAEALLEAGADIEAVEMRGFTPLHLAAFIGDEKLVLALLRRGANPNALNFYGDSPLLVYCGNDPERDPEALKKMVGNFKVSSHKKVKIVKLLLEKGNPRQRDSDGNTIFHHTCSFGHVHVLRYLLQTYPELFWQPNAQGYMPVEKAIRNKQLDTLKEFLKGLSESELQQQYRYCMQETKNRVCLATLLAKMDEPKVFEFYISTHKEAAYQTEATPQKLTPLHHAAMKGHVGILVVYLKKGLKLDTKDSFENTAAHLSVLGQHTAFVKLLLQNPGIWNLCNHDKRTPLHLAAAKGSEEIVELILSIKPEISKDGNGEYPLHIACRYGRRSIIPQLCNQHTDLEILNDDENTPLHLACIQGDLAIVTELVKRKAKISAKNIFGETPLHLAAQYGHEKIVEFLQQQGADNIAVDSQGKPPLHHAVSFRHAKSVETILANEQRSTLPLNVSFVNFPDLNQETCLMELTKRKPLSPSQLEKGRLILEMLFKHGADPEFRNNNGETFIHLASRNGQADLLYRFLEYRKKHAIKFHPHAIDNLGNNALHKACEVNERETAAVCINDFKIDVNGLNGNAYSPLHLCIINGFTALAEDLIYKHRASLTLRTKEKNTLLHLILSKTELNADLCRLLHEIVLLEPRLIFSLNKAKKTPLHILAENNHLQVLEILLSSLPGSSSENKKYVWRETSAPENLSAYGIAKRDGYEELATKIRQFPEKNYGSKCRLKL